MTIRVAWQMQMILLLIALPCTALALLFLQLVLRGELSNLFLFLLFALLAYTGWANTFSTILVTDESVTVTVMYGRFRIHWDEVERISRYGHLIALLGKDGKRVVLSTAYSGRNSQAMLDYFRQQSERRKIPFERSRGFPITHANARVWW